MAGSLAYIQKNKVTFHSNKSQQLRPLEELGMKREVYGTKEEPQTMVEFITQTDLAVQPMQEGGKKKDLEISKRHAQYFLHNKN